MSRSSRLTTQPNLQFLILILIFALPGCSTVYRAPDPAKIPELHTASLQQRAETMRDGNVRVSVAALSSAESKELFGLPLGDDGIQPVWIEIENRDARDYFFSPLSVDRDYYAPFELAWKYQGYTSSLDLNELGLSFSRHQTPHWVPAGQTVSGFVYTQADQGAKALVVDLLSDGGMKRFDFVVEVPGLRADYLQVDWSNLYARGEVMKVGSAELRDLLESLPCCALGADRERPGDPLNLVVIAPEGQVLAPFIRQGWDLTETIHGSSVWRTIRSSLFGSQYRTSPVSPLFVFGRSQDVALQKARRTVDERNHLRLWLTPYDFRGRQVWIGQISRDIGIRLTTKTLVTHKIDPDVDETRDFLIQDLIGSQNVERIGYVSGAGAATMDRPRFNYTGDPYWTDGLRAIIQLSADPVPISRIGYVDWAPPAASLDTLETAAKR